MILLLSVFPFAFLDGVKHSDMRKVYVDLLCGGFTIRQDLPYLVPFPA